MILLKRMLFEEPWPILILIVLPFHFIGRRMAQEDVMVQGLARRVGVLTFPFAILVGWSLKPPLDTGRFFELICRSLVLAWLVSCLSRILLPMLAVSRWRLPRLSFSWWYRLSPAFRREAASRQVVLNQQGQLEKVIHELRSDCHLTYLRLGPSLQTRLPRERFEELLANASQHCSNEATARARAVQLQETLRELARAPQGEPLVRDVGELFRWKTNLENQLNSTVSDPQARSLVQAQFEARFEELLKRTIEESAP